MTFIELVFWVLSALLVTGALMMITVKNPVHSALWLVFCFVSAAGIWLLQQAEFLAIVLVLVYVGAVMVLFLFVLMMLDVRQARERESFWRLYPVALITCALLAWSLSHTFIESFADKETILSDSLFGLDNSRALGLLLYTQYLYPVQLAAVILLVAIVASISLTLRHGAKLNKSMDPAQQISVRKQDRIRLVSRLNRDTAVTKKTKS